MAAAAILSSPISSQEHMELPLRTLDPPPPSGQSTTSTNNTNSVFGVSGFGQLPNLQSIDDFDKEHPFQARLQGTKLIPIQNGLNLDTAIKFQHLCDKHHIRPVFEYDEPWPYAFKAKVTFDDESVETEGVFTSKKHAKEAVSKLAYDRLLLKPVASAKRKAEGEQGVNSAAAVDRSENWVGLLVENGQRSKKHTPAFQELATDTFPIRFACAIRLDGGPLEPFQAEICAKKPDAKAASAKLAVEWLRSEGLMTASAKRRKSESKPKPQIQAQPAGITQALADVDINTEPAEPTSSYRQRVHILTAALGFQQPEFRKQSVNTATTVKPSGVLGPMFDMAAYFNAKDVAVEPRLEGPIGLVERVFGNQKAREACCAKVLPVLESIRESRMVE